MRKEPTSDSEALYTRTIEILKSWGLPFDPKSYELAYVYAEGSNTPLKREIEALIRSGHKLSVADVTMLRLRHLRQERMAERVDNVRERLTGEVNQIVQMIEASLGIQDNFRFSLQDSRDKLYPSIDRETLRSIVDSVVTLAHDVQQQNLSLGHSLEQSRDDIAKLQNKLNAVRAESLTDPLTGIANRTHLNQFLKEALKRAIRTRRPLTLMMADIDHFKKLNDNYGHLTGDEVIRLVANTLRKTLKGTDLVARYGGEEFAIVLPDTTLENGCLLAEKLRSTVESCELIKRSTGERLDRVTVSIGVSAWHYGETEAALIEATDACLYAAKKKGRNCVVSELQLNNLVGTGRKAS